MSVDLPAQSNPAQSKPEIIRPLSLIRPDEAEVSPQTKSPRSKLRAITSYFTVGLAVIVGSIFAQATVVCEIGILFYGIYALAKGVRSTTTFALALITLVATVAIFVIYHRVDLGGNFATYAFLFLIIGIISMIRESLKS
jgi:hypothetical protein